MILVYGRYGADLTAAASRLRAAGLKVGLRSSIDMREGQAERCDCAIVLPGPGQKRALKVLLAADVKVGRIEDLLPTEQPRRRRRKVAD